MSKRWFVLLLTLAGCGEKSKPINPLSDRLEPGTRVMIIPLKSIAGRRVPYLLNIQAQKALTKKQGFDGEITTTEFTNEDEVIPVRVGTMGIVISDEDDQETPDRSVLVRSDKDGGFSFQHNVIRPCRRNLYPLPLRPSAFGY